MRTKNYALRVGTGVVLMILSIPGFVGPGSHPNREPGDRILETKPASAGIAGPRKAEVSSAYGKLPLSFEANRGQTDSQVKFLSRGNGYTLFLTSTEAVLALRKPDTATPRTERSLVRNARALVESRSGEHAIVRMKLVGSRSQVRVEGVDKLPGTSNYFIGKDPKKWRSNVPSYAKVRYQSIYPGVDLVYYGNQRQLEYDFVVTPGADPGTIRLAFEGVDKPEVNDRGDLVLHTGSRPIEQRKPRIYQEVDGCRQEIIGGYMVRGQEVGFQLGEYDSSRPLVIDPVLVYSTFLGGNSLELGFGIAVDATGNAYVTGTTGSTNFPTANPFQADQGGLDAFDTKLNPAGSGLVYSTYLGGGSVDQGFDIAVDSFGNALVTGQTSSTNFPTASALQPLRSGSSDAFVTKLNSGGSALVYSTYLGGGAGEVGTGIAGDGSGNAYITGLTESSNFPTLNPLQSFQGGGADAFITKLNSTGSAMLYSTFLGGSGFDYSVGVAVDASENAYITGLTACPNFPTANAFQPSFGGGGNDAFVAKLNAAGSVLIYSSYLGGSNTELISGGDIAVDSSGTAVVIGETSSVNFPTTQGAFDTSYNGSSFDAFVAKIGEAVGPPATLTLEPAADTNPVGSEHCVTATVKDAGGNPVPGVTVQFSVTGANGGASGANVTDSNGQATFCYTGTTVGLDTITAFADTNNNGAQDPGEPAGTATKMYVPAAPVTLTLSPPTATNPVDTQHGVTATVRDFFANPVPGVTVRFTVTVAVNTSGSATTDGNGQAQFCYMGPSLPGVDTIAAYADTNQNNVQDAGEPSGAATKTWGLPVTTPLCEIKISNGGRITALNGDKATFGGNAKSDAAGNTQGQEDYQDHGPAQPLNVHSINVQAIVCEGSTQASIFGRATINGAGSFFYRIRVMDLGEPGVGRDSYGILLQTGYNSGEKVLEGGNVQIRRK